MNQKKQIARRVLPVFLALLLVAVGCGASGNNDRSREAMPEADNPSFGAATSDGGYDTAGEYAWDDYEHADYAEATDAPDMGGIMVNPTTGGSGESSSVQLVATQDRKIVYTVDLNLETKTFEEGIATIESLTEEFGGYVQSSSTWGNSIYDGTGGARSSYHSVRVPVELLEDFIYSLESGFNVTYNSRYLDDITDRYYDVQAHIDSLETAYAQLEVMLEQAEELEYLIEVQREMTSVRYQLDSLLAARSRMDSQVSMSTVNIHLEEVLEYRPQTAISTSFSERVSLAFAGSWRGFVQFCQNFVLGLIEALPFVILLVVIIVVIVIVFRSRRKKRRAALGAFQNPADSPPIPPAQHTAEPQDGDRNESEQPPEQPKQ